MKKGDQLKTKPSYMYEWLSSEERAVSKSVPNKRPWSFNFNTRTEKKILYLAMNAT